MDPSPKALSLVLLLCSLCAPCSPAEFCCGTVVPESPVLELGKTFTATCVLSEHGHQQTGATADDIYWEFANVTVDRKYYTKINESAVSVTVNVTQDLRSPLKCNVATRVLPRKNVHGIFFTVGYPPEKPNNLSCIVVQSGTNISSKMSCKWDRGARDPLLETTYIIHASFFNKHFSGTSTDKNHGELDFGVLPIYVIMNISVEVANKLGRISSDILTRDPLDFLKVNPPKDVTVSCEEAFPTALMVKWEHPLVSPEIPLLYNIRFSAAGTNVWSEISPDDIPSEISSFRLQNLKPNTVYAVQVRCMYFESKMYWSDWSESVMEKTPEDKPTSTPDLWRVIISSKNNSERQMRLIWKDPVHSNGKILGYNINVTSHHKVLKMFHLAPTNDSINKLDYPLPEKKEIITFAVTASNSVGTSPPAFLTVNREERRQVEEVNCTSQDDKLWVSWEPPTVQATEFLLEWDGGNERDWQREPGSARSAALKGNLQPFKFYNVSVYPLYSSVPGKPCTVGTYLKQGAPLSAPAAKAENAGKHEVDLEWPEIPLDDRQGFIVNYTIIYRDSNSEKTKTVSPAVHSYKLTSLASNSRYEVKIMASTIAGSKNGTAFTFHTRKYAVGEIEAIVVSVCISFLFLTVMTMAFCINKKKMIKKIIWPQVPDPSNSTIANWSPDFPSRPESPKEGSMTDVSVVEVDIFDKKSVSEEILKKDKYSSEEHSSGIGGSSCMSSPRQSVSDCDEGDSGQTTASTVQYSSVVANVYKGQTPASVPPSFARSESTQPLLDCEERPEDLQGQEGGGPLPAHRDPKHPYFRRPWAISEDNSLNLNQIEIGEQNSSSLGFCPVEEGSQQATPTAEDFLPDGTVSSGPCYMPQLNGYRPQ